MTAGLNPAGGNARLGSRPRVSAPTNRKSKMHTLWVIFVVMGVLLSVFFLYATGGILTAKAVVVLAHQGARKGTGIRFRFYRWDWDEEFMYVTWGAMWPVFWTFVLPVATLLAAIGVMTRGEGGLSGWIERTDDKKRELREARAEERRLAREAKNAPKSLKKIEKELSDAVHR